MKTILLLSISLFAFGGISRAQCAPDVGVMVPFSISTDTTAPFDPCDSSLKTVSISIPFTDTCHRYSYVWDNGATTSSTSMYADGEHQVIVYDSCNTCSRTVYFYTCSPAIMSVNAVAAGDSKMLVFPNPNNGSFTLRSASGRQGTVCVATIDGKQIYSAPKLYTEQAYTLDLLPGFYVVQLYEDGLAPVMQRFMVSK